MTTVNAKGHHKLYSNIREDLAIFDDYFAFFDIEIGRFFKHPQIKSIRYFQSKNLAFNHWE
jgi:hypothetical protein